MYASKEAQKLLNRGMLFCSFEKDPDDSHPFHAVLWRWGGHINKSAQPWKIIDVWATKSETQLRVGIEAIYPGVEYRQTPTNDKPLEFGPENKTGDAIFCRLLHEMPTGVVDVMSQLINQGYYFAPSSEKFGHDRCDDGIRGVKY